MIKIDLCLYCKTLIKSKRRNQVTCGARECQLAHQNRRSTIANKTRNCTECKEEYKPRSAGQKTCGKAACKESRRLKTSGRKEKSADYDNVPMINRFLLMPVASR